MPKTPKNFDGKKRQKSIKITPLAPLFSHAARCAFHPPYTLRAFKIRFSVFPPIEQQRIMEEQNKKRSDEKATTNSEYVLILSATTATGQGISPLYSTSSVPLAVPQR